MLSTATSHAAIHSASTADDALQGPVDIRALWQALAMQGDEIRTLHNTVDHMSRHANATMVGILEGP